MTNRERRQKHEGLVESIQRIHEIVSEKNADTMSNDELLDACIDLAACRTPTPPPSETLETTMASLRRVTDGSGGAAFGNNALHDTGHEATLLFEAEYGLNAHAAAGR